MHAVKNIIDPFIEIRSCEALFISIIKESFELSRAMAKNERRSMSDPSEVMGGSDLRCLKPQSQKFQSRELEIAFEHKSAQ